MDAIKAYPDLDDSNDTRKANNNDDVHFVVVGTKRSESILHNAAPSSPEQTNED